ncbi:Fe-S cluster assembly protein SufD [Pseudobdellovibrio exovorus]|uniref:Transport protein involved in the n=1 Tax=Pseudobdellovibrio exovorus JSS TaxID=1184267 RepID=M4VDI2_9BACT|nr:Fe-S cluster assembly protein SufD [Pseudobdellovibrio exovorus]AGH96530.1 transport protein involved in the [Pseudobdellovibrio exovorus JSS]
MSWETSYLNFKNRAALDSVKANEERQKSFERFVAEGLPTRRDEAWKFTSLTGFKEIDWKSHEDDEMHLTHEQMQEVSKNLPSDFINFVFVNGILNNTLSDDADGLIEITELEESDFSTATENVEERLLNLAQAFLQKKINLKVLKHRQIDKPVQVVFVQSSKNSVYLSEKLNVHLEENSELKLLVHSMSFINSTADAINLNVNVQVDKSARLTFVQLQDEDAGSYHFSQVQISLQASAWVQSLALSLGNRLVRNYLHLRFNEENAEAEVYGLGVLDEQQHLDNYTFIEHAVGHNQSVQHYKSILSGAAHSVFRGRVRIAQDAQKANSEQLNNNLLLTRQAQADSIPQLEIYADDVKAGHGSTVGQLNKEEIFYFLSRGINQFQAVKMLSFGFAKELVYKVKNETLQNYLLNSLNKKLERMVQNG